MTTDDEVLGQITRLLDNKFQELRDNIREQIAFGDNTNRQIIEFVRTDLANLTHRLEQVVSNRDHENRIRALEHDKVDRTDLVPFTTRLDTHGHDIGVLKDQMREDEAAQKALTQDHTQRVAWRRWAVEALSGLALIVVTWGASTGWHF